MSETARNVEPALVYTYAQTAALLKSKVSAVRALVRAGKLPVVIIGHQHLVVHEQLIEFLRGESTTEVHSDRRPARLRGTGGNAKEDSYG